MHEFVTQHWPLAVAAVLGTALLGKLLAGLAKWAAILGSLAAGAMLLLHYL